MTLPIFPVSPVWAAISWTDSWAGEIYRYDSGQRQGATPFVRPLAKFSVSALNYNEVKFALLNDFNHQTRGMVDPFLWKFPYGGNNPYGVEAVTQPTSTNLNSGDTFQFVNSAGWAVIPDSAFIFVDETGPGERVNGTDFVMSQDNGVATLLVTPGGAWTASFEYFRKCAFDAPLSQTSNLYQSFAGQMSIEELPP